MALVACANRCPRHCRDLQEGLVCGQEERCQPGCRCPNGESCLSLCPPPPLCVPPRGAHPGGGGQSSGPPTLVKAGGARVVCRGTRVCPVPECPSSVCVPPSPHLHRHPGAGRGLRAPHPLRVHRRGGAQLGAGEPPPRWLRELQLRRGPPALHPPGVPPHPLRLEPLEPLGTLQRHLRGRAADPLQVTWHPGGHGTQGRDGTGWGTAPGGHTRGTRGGHAWHPGDTAPGDELWGRIRCDPHGC